MLMIVIINEQKFNQFMIIILSLNPELNIFKIQIC